MADDTPIARSKQRARMAYDQAEHTAQGPSITTQMAQALQNVRALRASLSDTQAMLAAAHDEEARIRAAHDGLAETCATLRARVIDLEASLARRTREVSALRTVIEDPGRGDSAALRSLRDEMAAIRAEIAACARREQLQAQANEALRLQLASAEARAAEAAVRSSSLHSEARSRDAQLAAANAEIAALADRQAGLERERESLRATLLAAREDMSDLRAVLSDGEPVRRVTFADQQHWGDAPTRSDAQCVADAKKPMPGDDRQPPSNGLAGNTESRRTYATNYNVANGIIGSLGTDSTRPPTLSTAFGATDANVRIQNTDFTRLPTLSTAFGATDGKAGMQYADSTRPPTHPTSFTLTNGFTGTQYGDSSRIPTHSIAVSATHGGALKPAHDAPPNAVDAPRATSDASRERTSAEQRTSALRATLGGIKESNRELLALIAQRDAPRM